MVTNTDDGFPGGVSGHTGVEAVEHYGGVLICESIFRKKDVALISAAPDLLEACLEARVMYEAQGINEESRIGGEQYKRLVFAIGKAMEGF